MAEYFREKGNIMATHPYPPPPPPPPPPPHKKKPPLAGHQQLNTVCLNVLFIVFFINIFEMHVMK